MAARRWTLPLIALALIQTTAAQLKSAADADDAKANAYGRHLAQECASCHRMDGADDGIPPIVGRPAEELTAALRLYQEGKRTNPVMVSVARSLNDAQVDAVAGYLASLPKAPGRPR